MIVIFFRFRVKMAQLRLQLGIHTQWKQLIYKRFKSEE
jgi:hypothetical protein